MRNPLNKAMQPANKNIAERSAGKDRTMNKEFQKVIAAASSISSNVPQLREEYIKEIEAAQAAQVEAKKAKEEALTGVDFDNACDRERNAREKEVVFKRKLEALDFTPRMDEQEYNNLVKSVQTVVEHAAADYRERAMNLMSELAVVHRNYIKLTADADQALETLDMAANVLQSKHRYREYTYQGAPSQYVQDSNEWRHHTVRYQPTGEAGKLVFMDKHENAPATYNKLVYAAWNAVDAIQDGTNTRRISV